MTKAQKTPIPKFPYRWTLDKAKFPKDKGKVFTCFAGGGGSTMGYKLAGFDVIGCNEIDPRQMKLYKQNHNPKYAFSEPIQELKLRDDLPDELYQLDILDGSPPCSSFSMAGARERDWGKEKRFKEGQMKQVLDTLFFDFIDLTKKLQPKVVIAENVKGLTIGKAKGYLARICEAFDKAGYYVRYWLLNGADMGLPQRRERIFFVCLRKDLAHQLISDTGKFIPLTLEFNSQHIPFGECADYQGRELNKETKMYHLWTHRQLGDKDQGEANLRLYGKESNFSHQYIDYNKPSPTLTAKAEDIIHFNCPRLLSSSEVCCASSFPMDYDFMGQAPHYVCGMSVPPIMMANVASEVYSQLLKRLR